MFDDVRYEVYPRVFRMRPLATLLVVAVMFAGFLVVGVGRYAPPPTLDGLLPGLSSQAVQNLGVLMFFLGCVRLYAWYAPARFERFTVTNDSLIYLKGFASKQRIVIPLNEVQSVRVAQTPWQRMLSIGDISVFAGGNESPVLVLRGLPDPETIPPLVSGQVPAAAVA